MNLDMNYEYDYERFNHTQRLYIKIYKWLNKK